MKQTTTGAPKPPVGLLGAHREALTLHESVNPYARRRLERLRFNLDAALPWVEASQCEAREEDMLWLRAVASELAATSQQVSSLLRAKAFNDADWVRQAGVVLLAIDNMLSRYAKAGGNPHWTHLDSQS